MYGLYLHIPFCASICNYCNFNRGLFDVALKERYLRAIECEILGSRCETRSAGLADTHRQADSVYFGGGTPSLLEPSEVERLLIACRTAFDVPQGAEITLEVNPESASPDKLRGFREAGVNRLSFGVQSFRDEELSLLTRAHSADQARRALAFARASGYDNISLDLMMWLPRQRLSDWLVSIDAAIQVSPDHLSTYLLELYPNAPLRDDMARHQWSQAADEDAAAMYLAAIERLEEAGYGQYEISNFARPGRQSRHNLKYWTDGEWFGFGSGAHSTVAGVRSKNIASIPEYTQRIASGVAAITERRTLSLQERCEEALFTGLRLTTGVSLDHVRSRYDVDVEQRYGPSLERLVEAGLLVFTERDEERRMYLTRRGMLLANEVMAVFV